MYQASSIVLSVDCISDPFVLALLVGLLKRGAPGKQLIIPPSIFEARCSDLEQAKQ